MISYFQFRETHYCDTARTAGGRSPHGGKGGNGGNGGGGNGGGGNGGGGNGGGGNGGGGNGGGGNGGGGNGGGGGGRPDPRHDPPPETVTVPPAGEPPVKPPRVPVHNGESFDPFGGVLEGVFGEPTQPTQPTQPPPEEYDYVPEAEQEVIIEQEVPIEEPVLPPSTCPRNCSIIHIPTGIVAVDNRMCSCSTIERYEQDPNYRVEFTTQLPEVPIEEPVVVTPGVLTWYYVKKPSGICERLNVSQNFVNQMTSQGWIFSLTDICATEPEPEEPETVDVIPPGVAETSCYMVHGQKLELTEQAVGYYINAGVTVTPCEVEPEPTTPLPPTTTPTGLANFGIAGILFAGVLALPILAGLGKWK